MKKVSKYEYENGPLNGYWKDPPQFRGHSAAPSPILRKVFIAFAYFSFLYGVYLVVVAKDSFGYRTFPILLVFIGLDHNPFRIPNMIQNVFRTLKKNTTIYDKFVDECNYFLTNDKIRAKLKVKKVKISYFNSAVIILISKNNQKKVKINKNKIIIKTRGKDKIIITNEYNQYDTIKRYSEYLYEIIK